MERCDSPLIGRKVQWNQKEIAIIRDVYVTETREKLGGIECILFGAFELPSGMIVIDKLNYKMLIPVHD